jgi:hypothetical protein
VKRSLLLRLLLKGDRLFRWAKGLLAHHLDGVFPQHFPAKDLEGFAIVSFKQWNDLS